MLASSSRMRPVILLYDVCLSKTVHQGKRLLAMTARGAMEGGNLGLADQ